jgi:hypothetical protein
MPELEGQTSSEDAADVNEEGLLSTPRLCQLATKTMRAPKCFVCDGVSPLTTNFCSQRANKGETEGGHTKAVDCVQQLRQNRREAVHAEKRRLLHSLRKHKQETAPRTDKTIDL